MLAGYLRSKYKNTGSSPSLLKSITYPYKLHFHCCYCRQNPQLIIFTLFGQIQKSMSEQFKHNKYTFPFFFSYKNLSENKESLVAISENRIKMSMYIKCNEVQSNNK